MNCPKQICLHRVCHREEGFHYLVCLDGTIMTFTKVTEESDNAKGHNKDVISIAVEGDFRFEPVSDIQLSSLKILILQLCNEYNLDTTMHQIFTHCDYRDPPGDRTCPGKEIHRKIPEIAKWVREMLIKGVR